MTVGETRRKYFTFFEKRDHVLIPSASLVPENDPTTLFTSSGMQPLLPYFLGGEHPKGKRLVDSQKCFRAEDIEEVGDNRHTTFFEMLGNWSLGDYFKKEQLRWFFEFLTDATAGVGLDPSRLFVTVFAGDEEYGIPRDNESARIWKELFNEKGIGATEAIIESEEEGYGRGMKKGERIFYYGVQKNWWSRAGGPDKMPTGEPGGGDSEIFFDFDPTGAMHDKNFGEYCHPNCGCGRFMEIGNSVFMEYIKGADGRFKNLKQKNVDFGGGLERITAAVRDNPDVFTVDTLSEIISRIESLSGKGYGEEKEYIHSFRIVADHIRGVVFMMADGVMPGNTERDYFVRRLLRRAVRHMDILCAEPCGVSLLVSSVVKKYKGEYPNLEREKEKIETEIGKEEGRFRKTLERGLREFDKIAGHGTPDISGKQAFHLYQTYGLPIDVTSELALERGLGVDKGGFLKELSRHRKVSRVGAEKKFKGGLADHSDISIKYHTATHLLHRALRDVLGGGVLQKGSNITPERLRFDFAFARKLTDEEVRMVEKIVNEKIKEALPVSFEIIPAEEARQRGALGIFTAKYGDKVKVYKIGRPDVKNNGEPYSFEFCGGPHVSNTSEIGEGGKKFSIKKEKAVSAGVRRIRAVLE